MLHSEYMYLINQFFVVLNKFSVIAGENADSSRFMENATWFFDPK